MTHPQSSWNSLLAHPFSLKKIGLAHPMIFPSHHLPTEIMTDPGVLQCFGNLKILPFWRCRLENIQMLWMLPVLWLLLWRLLSQVAKKKLVPLVIHITDWKIYQRENQEHALQWAIKMGKARSVWEQAPKKCAVMVIKLLSFCSVFFFFCKPEINGQRSARLLEWMKDHAV